MKLKLAKIINLEFDGSFNQNGFDGWRLYFEIKDVENGRLKKITADGNIDNIFFLMEELRKRKTIFYRKYFDSLYLIDSDFYVRLKKGFLLRYKFAE